MKYEKRPIKRDLLKLRERGRLGTLAICVCVCARVRACVCAQTVCDGMCVHGFTTQEVLTQMHAHIHAK